MHSYQEPKSPRESHPSARRREPQAGAGQANGPALLRFGWAICDYGLLRQPDLADLNFLPRRISKRNGLVNLDQAIFGNICLMCSESTSVFPLYAATSLQHDLRYLHFLRGPPVYSITLGQQPTHLFAPLLRMIFFRRFLPSQGKRRSCPIN